MIAIKTKVWTTLALGVFFLAGIAAVDFFVLGGDISHLFRKQLDISASLRGSPTETIAPQKSANKNHEKSSLRFFPTDQSKTFLLGEPVEVYCSSAEKTAKPKFVIEQKETVHLWNELPGAEGVETDEKVGVHLTFMPEAGGVLTLRCKTNYSDGSTDTAVGSFYVTQL